MDYFKIIPDNFFQLLASKNKRVYLSLILEAFKVYENASILGIEKKIVVDELVHYLDTNKYKYEVEDNLDEEANPSSHRDLANYVLRRMEETGWIYIDVTHDYEEVLNFSDAGITICEAIINLNPRYYEDNLNDETEEITSHYQGYIYTIYSLLNNNDNIEYSVIIQEVYRNTKLLLREIRKLDARLKEYIAGVFNETDVKELMENLVSYREDFVEQGYAKLKMGDNINRYRLRIVTKLEEYQNSSLIMDTLTLAYPSLNKEKALLRANRDIDEMIDVFNSLDEYILEIDEKSKTYINSTIAKIKFLVSEDDNIIGKLNRILRYIKDENKEGHVDKAINKVNDAFNLSYNRSLSQDSLYIPRGAYKRNYNLLLDDSRLEGFDIEADFYGQYEAPYQETNVEEFLLNNLVDDKFIGSNFLKNDTPKSYQMLVIYAILFALENDKMYDVTILDSKIETTHLKMRDFIIRKES